MTFVSLITEMAQIFNIFVKCNVCNATKHVMQCDGGMGNDWRDFEQTQIDEI